MNNNRVRCIAKDKK